MHVSNHLGILHGLPMSDWFERFGYAEVADNLLIGAYPLDAEDVAALAGAGVTAIFNLVEDAEYGEGEREVVVEALAASGIREQRMSFVDYGALLPGQLEQAVDAMLAWLEAGERVYLHCRAGWQRSAAVAAGVVALRDEVDLAEALERIAARKPSADPLPHQRHDLANWWVLRRRKGSAEAAPDPEG
jgi:protein-tyrosine phosphatase